MAGINLRGLQALQRGMRVVGRRYENAAGGALYLQGSRTIAESVPLTPVDTNDLRASAFVSSPSIRAGRLTVRMGYGTDYAVPVHERTKVFHKVGAAKFLRIPFDNQKRRAARNIALDTKRLFIEGRGFGDINHPFPTKPKLTSR